MMKPYLLISARIGAGGEFLTSMIFSHDCEHWPFRIHCHSHHYSRLVQFRRPNLSPVFRSHCPDFYTNSTIRHFDTEKETGWTHERLDYKVSIMPSLKQLTLDYPLDDLIEFRKCRQRTQPECIGMTKPSKIRDWYDSFDLSKSPGAHVDHFNPLNNYYETCDYLEMQPNIDHWIKSWKSYLTFGFHSSKGSYLNDKYRRALRTLK